MTKTQLVRGFRRAKIAFVSDSMVFFVVYLAILGGIPIIIDPVMFAPVSVQTFLTELITRMWGIDLLAGGFLCGAGLLTERPRIERAGLACLSTGALIYGLAIGIYGGLAALLPLMTYAFFSIAAVARYYKLGKVLDGIEFARHINDGRK